MKNYLTLCIIMICITSVLNSQVGINTTDPQAQLDIRSSNQAAPIATDGILIPKVDVFPTGVSSNQDAMMVYLTTTVGSDAPGFYYYSHGAGWLPIGSGARIINDLIDGKSDNDGSDNGSSIFLGIDAGLNDDSSNNHNIGVGFQSLRLNSTGSENTAIGHQALSLNTTGTLNVATGFRALFLNAEGSYNTATGYRALRYNTEGNGNVATGYQSLYRNITGNSNIATGNNSLLSNTEGDYNIATGTRALGENLIGSFNIANGYYALNLNTEGNSNIAIGTQSQYSNITGDYNVAYGAQSLYGNSTGSYNIALGYRAGYNETGSNRLYIENSSSAFPLIYGEFDTDLLRINGTLDINNAYQFPTADGTVNQIMQTDGAGNVTWANAVINEINDLTDAKSDNDGSENGSSIFLGIGAGINDDSSDNRNIGIGYQSLNLTNIGDNNVAFDYQSLINNSTGSNNIAIGYETLNNNITGSSNIAIGFQAGYNETGSNRLYIENSGTNNALIYGEFDNDFIRINGSLDVTDDLSVTDNLNVTGTIDVTEEINRVATGNANIVPIAYGTVESNGNVLSGTGNFTASLASGVLTISVNTVTLSVNNTSCVVTPYSTAFRTSSIIISGGDIQVRIFNSSGTLTPTTFQFTIYKL
ncbi:beta strand repeat-containing protein [Winogradskyella sp. PG-2]|uniref:beta strand repeat-containing protein n=1 Tax=Winogradskyella sp. PG-2 TaxID=754409 RepID=UPI0004587A09|nr:hypothetical protein [Winogradskyella sp. PG-2]BAO74536.1 hypothetical protein WPG_0306 [Winogradskyella sp. PG-2]